MGVRIDRLDHVVRTVADPVATCAFYHRARGKATARPLAEIAIRPGGLKGVPMDDGPGERTSATGSIRSVYSRDSDGNLIEVSRDIDSRARVATCPLGGAGV